MHFLRRTLTLGALVLGICLMATTAVAQDTTHSTIDNDTDFETVVRGIDTLPNIEMFTDRWPDAEERLIELALDQERSEYLRWRATSLLANFSTDAVEQTLVELTEAEERRIRAMAYTILTGAFLDDGDDGLFELIERGLGDESDQVRHRIVRTLPHADHPDAESLLRRLAEDDSDPQVQRLATRALGQ